MTQAWAAASAPAGTSGLGCEVLRVCATGALPASARTISWARRAIFLMNGKGWGLQLLLGRPTCSISLAVYQGIPNSLQDARGTPRHLSYFKSLSGFYRTMFRVGTHPTACRSDTSDRLLLLPDRWKSDRAERSLNEVHGGGRKG